MNPKKCQLMKKKQAVASMKPLYCTGEVRNNVYEVKMCPRCSNNLPYGYPGAISRRDNATELCSTCGVYEAYEDMHVEATK